MNRTLNKPLLQFSRKKAANVLLGCFFVVTIIAPVAAVNKLLFGVLTLWMLNDMLFARTAEVQVMTSPAIIFAIFLYGFVLSLFNHADAALALQLVLGVLILFQIWLIRRYQIDVERLVMISTVAMVVATMLLWCATFLPNMPMGPALLEFFRVYSLSAFGEREFFESATISLHLGAAPILFVGFALFAKKFCQERRIRDFLFALATTLAMLLSASRGIIAGAGLYFLILVLVYAPRRIRILLALLLVAMLAYSIHKILTSTSLLSASETSNAAKAGHVTSFLDQLTVPSLLFGRGLANWYYSVGVQSLKAETEISPMDMVRYFGIVLTLILYFCIVFPVRKIGSYIGGSLLDVVIFMIYLLLSFTNPIMFNSMGMLVILWYWSRIHAAHPVRRPAANTGTAFT